MKKTKTAANQLKKVLNQSEERISLTSNASVNNFEEHYLNTMQSTAYTTTTLCKSLRSPKMIFPTLSTRLIVKNVNLKEHTNWRTYICSPESWHITVRNCRSLLELQPWAQLDRKGDFGSRAEHNKKKNQRNNPLYHNRKLHKQNPLLGVLKINRCLIKNRTKVFCLIFKHFSFWMKHTVTYNLRSRLL